MNNRLMTGTSNKTLAKKVADKLRMPLEKAVVNRFSDGEIGVELMNNVRGATMFVIQPVCAPVNDSLMELALMTDALKRAAAEKVVAVCPYFGYARQDRRNNYARVPISARVVADILQSSGVDHLIVCDMHAMQIEGFFKIPVDNIAATNLFVADIYSRWMDENPIMVSPDVGGVGRARACAKHLDNMDLAIVDKRRPKANVSEVMNIIGDVRDRTCIIIDDMVDTAGTLGKAATALVDVGGARRVIAYATHGVLSGKAKENLLSSKLQELIVTDTIPIDPQFMEAKVRVLSITGTLAEVIRRVIDNKSISEVVS